MVATRDTNETVDQTEYFIHASNNHRLPPIRPPGMHLLTYVYELVCVLICYFWFTACCLVVPTRDDTGFGLCEDFGSYLARICLPDHFIRYYLLPLMSAVTTCPHDVLLGFPASDVVNYKRCIISGRQLTVSEGVNKVQDCLLRDLQVQYSAVVRSVEPMGGRIAVEWYRILGREPVVVRQIFDKVVLAVPPDVVAAVFSPLRSCLVAIPTTSVRTIVHYEPSMAPRSSDLLRKGGSSIKLSNQVQADVIHLRTSPEHSCTEATHVQPSGIMVTSCPLMEIAASSIIRSSTFTRTLRTPESRRCVNNIFGLHGVRASHIDEKRPSWRNGDDGVFLVGSWCWDGMVLLEGCIVSAMRTAVALEVDIPWKTPARPHRSQY